MQVSISLHTPKQAVGVTGHTLATPVVPKGYRKEGTKKLNS